ncbi:MAG TPA: alpha/beta fold hydrolase [Candidatus Binatia bacterium]|nr:alpha/beta fold hydrolase [Candidatus Binatia bacterium]
MVEEAVSFSNARGETLKGALYHASSGAARGAVLLCHGMESNKESEKLVRLSRSLAERNIPSLRFDFSYVGESSGIFENITYSGEVEDLSAAFSYLTGRFPGKIGILGSSMGGTVALLFAAQQAALAALATVGAPIHPENFPTRLLTPAEVGQWRKQGFIFYHGQKLNITLLDDLEKINVPAAAKEIACPVLILHGDSDEMVPVDEAHELYGHLRSVKKLVILKGADHGLSDPDLMTGAVTQVIEWFCRYVG